MTMFCYQCEQTAGGTGCTKRGVCGKDEAAAVLQDLLVHQANGIGALLAETTDEAADAFILDALFSSVTNVNFDVDRLADLALTGDVIIARLLAEGKSLPANYQRLEVQPGATADDLIELGRRAAIPIRCERFGETVTGLMGLVQYGLKGTAAYAHHARILGQTSEAVDVEFHRLLAVLASETAEVPDLLQAALDVGALNLQVMQLLDAGNTGRFGHPEPTNVRMTPVAGKAILVSGHDLADLELLLEQTAGKGINVYTHGEMLPCLAYPALKTFPHLVGNYGGAWQEQHADFDAFPGAILMTTNCVQKPRDSYVDRIFTTGLVAFPGVTHIGPEKDFTPVINAALAADGFAADAPEQTAMVGFGHNAVMDVADTIIQAVKDGAVRHFFLIGGCDGAKPGRNYYTDFAQQVPDDCVILTLACGKYRFNKLEFGDIGGIPRLLDIGQCNDAYSAIQIAVALAGAFECDVNDLPLSMILSWYEQKAVAILLTLLHLGIKGIRLGPSLPAFVTPEVLSVLVDTFDIAPISTPEADLAAILGE
jgi:hydroxylamine reductase